MSGRSLIHIGLPKAASTALQKHFFPRLGVPYVGYDDNDATRRWHKDIRYADTFTPLVQDQPGIISGEGLCGPGRVGSAVVAERLRATVADGVVLVVVRDLIAHFRSSYRETLLHEVGRMKGVVPPQGTVWKPKHVLTIDDFLTASLDQPAAGYFHFMDLDANLAHFKRHFKVLVVDHSLIVRQLPRFTALIRDETGLGQIHAMPDALPSENVSAVDELIASLDQISPAVVTPAVRAQLIESYTRATLSPAKKAQLEKFTHARCAKTFAEAVR